MKQNLMKLLGDLGCHDKELSILFTDDSKIAKLNARYMGRKGPTNVLAFPMADGGEADFVSAMMGDIVISIDTAERESTEFGEPLDATLYRLLIHGLLHLLGYDHTRSEAEALNMEKEEKRLLELILEE